MSENAPLIWLAPMEGLMDYHLRCLIRHIGGIDQTVSEFVRVSDAILSESVIRQQVPELQINNPQSSIRVQLMGSDPDLLAYTAINAINIGSEGIDFNFGCPSKTVNRRMGGAAMLNHPEQIHEIVKTARQAIGSHIAISAKIRLGYDDKTQMFEIADAIASAGADQLVVHGRTKSQGYKPPADWQAIGEIRKRLNIDVIANGDIFSPEDAMAVAEITGCNQIMIGRGLVYDPKLALMIKFDHMPSTRSELIEFIIKYSNRLEASEMPKGYISGRIKQLLKMMATRYPWFQDSFSKVKKINSTEELKQRLSELM